MLITSTKSVKDKQCDTLHYEIFSFSGNETQPVFCLILSHLKMWRKHILTSVWHAQHPNTGQNIQQPNAFVPFREIEKPTPNLPMRHVDVIGLISSIDDRSSDNSLVPYKRVTLQDEDGNEVVLMLWQNDAKHPLTNFWSPGYFLNKPGFSLLKNCVSMIYCGLNNNTFKLF